MISFCAEFGEGGDDVELLLTAMVTRSDGSSCRFEMETCRGLVGAPPAFPLLFPK